VISAPSLEQFRTPRGRAASLYVREGTADHNNVYSCLNEDEYRLTDLDLGEGVALDIGAHIGGVTIALALDNPQAHIIAVEALGANVEVLRANVETNGVGWSLADLPSDIAFAKIDCELCEYDVFTSPAVKRIAEIRGEFHAGYDRLAALLDATHVVTHTGGGDGTGSFKAVRR
jgi:tRNA G46 methylase TrmB